MAGGGSSREQNFWPGFVDALTNVILVMVLVVVIFTLSVFYFIGRLAQSEISRKVHVARSAYQIELERKLAATEGRIKQLNERISELETENGRLSRGTPKAGASVLAAQVDISADKNAPPPSGTGGPSGPAISVAKTPNAIVVSFAPSVTELDKKVYDSINSAVGSYDDATRWQIEMVAEAAEELYSEDRSLGFYRIAVLRNYFASKGVNPANIDTLIEDRSRGGTLARSRALIRIRK
ncbi:MAG: hypothetical protein MO853_08595 [Candidatus Protistobacter heckmanni]|nr:hypothetical protein [Candidatus Protistobacter heckmanni]